MNAEQYSVLRSSIAKGQLEAVNVLLQPIWNRKLSSQLSSSAVPVALPQMPYY